MEGQRGSPPPASPHWDQGGTAEASEASHQPQGLGTSRPSPSQEHQAEPCAAHPSTRASAEAGGHSQPRCATGSNTHLLGSQRLGQSPALCSPQPTSSTGPSPGGPGSPHFWRGEPRGCAGRRECPSDVQGWDRAGELPSQQPGSTGQGRRAGRGHQDWPSLCTGGPAGTRPPVQQEQQHNPGHKGLAQPGHLGKVALVTARAKAVGWALCCTCPLPPSHWKEAQEQTPCQDGVCSPNERRPSSAHKTSWGPQGRARDVQSWAPDITGAAPGGDHQLTAAQHT